MGRPIQRKDVKDALVIPVNPRSPTRTIRISEDVYNEIAERGNFGDTPDTVLRKVFGLKAKRDYRR